MLAWQRLGEFLNKEILHKPDRHGDVFYAQISGSHSYNLSLPTSDYDYRGVYAAPTSKVAGMDWSSKKDTWERTGVEGKSDFQFYEVGHFCRLLLKGNPNLIEMLFVKDNKYQDGTNYWWDLTDRHINSREGYNVPKSFLSRQVVKQYLGYMGGQLERLRRSQGGRGLHTAGGKQTEKWCYHIVRLGMDALDIAQGKEPTVFKTGERRDELMRIRENNPSFEEIERKIQDSILAVEALRPWGNLPEYGNKKFLEDWLLRIRKENW